MVAADATVRPGGPTESVMVRTMAALLLTVAVPAPFPGSDVAISVLAGVVAVVTVKDLHQQRTKLLRALPFVIPLVAIWSAAWSPLPLTSLRGSVELLTVTVAAWGLSRALSLRSLIGVLSLALRLLMLLSLVAVVVRPDIGLVSDAYEGGAIKGVFVHRNALAFAAVLALVTAGVRHGTAKRRLVFFDLALAGGCLIGARSQTSLITAAVVLALWAAVRFSVRFKGTARLAVPVVFAVSAAVALTWVTASFAELTKFLGRDITLTGRTDIWAAVIRESENAPILGGGWDSVWHRGLGVSYRIWSSVGFEMYHAHNGYLDMLLQLGAVGLMLLMTVTLFTIYYSTRIALGDANRTLLWPVSMGIVLLIANLTESSLTTSAGFMMLLLAFFYATRPGNSKSSVIALE